MRRRPNPNPVLARLLTVLLTGPLGGLELLAATVTFRGAAPCDTTLQACIDGVPAGTRIEIATTSPIAETLSIEKSLTLTRAPGGISPVLGGSGTYYAVYVDLRGDTPAAVSLIDLTLNNASVSADLSGAGAKQLEVRGCNISTVLSTGIDVTARGPSTVTIERNTVFGAGESIELRTLTETIGAAAMHVVGNVVGTVAQSPSGTDGIAVIPSTGYATFEVASNLLYGLTRMSILVEAQGSSGAADVAIVNNTIFGTVGHGIYIYDPQLGQNLSVDVFNNTVSANQGYGIRLPSIAPARLRIGNGYNNFFANTLGNSLGAFALGTPTLTVDPGFVSPGATNFRLSPASPLRDAGVNNPIGGLPAIDADGNLRVANGVVDLGAYEFDSTPPTTTTTTLPPVGCELGATFASIDCRLQTLRALVDTRVPAGSLASRLGGLVDTAAARARAAAAATTGRRRRLGKAIRALDLFARRLRSRRAIGAVTTEVRDELGAATISIRGDLATLRGG